MPIASEKRRLKPMFFHNSRECRAFGAPFFWNSPSRPYGRVY
jgi:hypothetical protein